MSFEKVPNFLGNFFGNEMTADEHRLFRFGSFRLDTAERKLLQGEIAIPLTPKAFDTLVFLVRNRGHLVSKDELMTAIWPDSFVDEGNLPRTIHTLRKALGQKENGIKFIETVPTKGYRFVAEVEETQLENPSSAIPHGSQGNENAIAELAQQSLNRPATGLRFTRYIVAASLLAVAVTGIFVLQSSVRHSWAAYVQPHQTNNSKAYQDYQQGRFFIERQLPGDPQRALENFDAAIQLDPGYSAAYAGRADAKIWLFWKVSASHDDISLARAAVDKAIELDSANSYAHTLSCRIKATYDWDFAGAEKECRMAVELDPNDDRARRELGMLLSSVGRGEEALTELDKAITLSPSSLNKRSRGQILYWTRRYDEAISQLQQLEDTDPEYGQGTLYLMMSYEMKMDWENALDCYIRIRRRAGAPTEDIESIKASFAKGGWTAILRSMTSAPDVKNDFQNAGNLAQLGETDKAFDVLNDMVNRRRVMSVRTASEPRLDPLRNDPRYTALLKRIGLQ